MALTLTRVLITGAGGFIGIHVIDHILTTTDWHIVALDSFRHKGITDRLRYSEHVRAHASRVTVFTHDLNAPFSHVLVHDIGPVDIILNLASDSHVDRSLDDPVRTVQNNVMLALHVLEYARVVQPRVFIQVSTDEVYGPVRGAELHGEWSTILPSNPYSASKAAQEALAIAYWRSFGVPVIITNTMNNFGEYQDPEKFTPKTIRCILVGEPVSIHATGSEIGSRCWLHARNHADALRWLVRHHTPARYPDAPRPDRFNVVGERRTNLEIVELIQSALGRNAAIEVVDYHTKRTGHDLHYGLDGTKLADLGWRPPVEFASSLAKTVQWYQRHPQWLAL